MENFAREVARPTWRYGRSRDFRSSFSAPTNPERNAVKLTENLRTLMELPGQIKLLTNLVIMGLVIMMGLALGALSYGH